MPLGQGENIEESKKLLCFRNFVTGDLTVYDTGKDGCHSLCFLIFQTYIFISRPVRQVADDELKHLIGRTHTPVPLAYCSWRVKRVQEIVFRIVINSHYHNHRAFRDPEYFFEGIKILPAEVPLADFYERNGVARGRQGKCPE